MLSRPTMETLYSGLDRDDVAAIGAALREAAVPFDVNAESTVVLVSAGQASTARMILAEKGLPRGGAVGNELFDKLGSLGLTSFMQDVTRLRALEGELARTIQMMRPVKAARVHIVLADEGSFRRERQPSSASVVIRTDGGDDRATGEAIRHLVASAVPGMKIDDVTVLNVDGRLLASGSDSLDKSPDNLLALEQEVSQEIRDSVTRTLTPYLSARNFQISVAARLNADKTQTNETIYNPDQRVERSVRVTKEQQSSQNAAGIAGGRRRGQPSQTERRRGPSRNNRTTRRRSARSSPTTKCRRSRSRRPAPASSCRTCRLRCSSIAPRSPPRSATSPRRRRSRPRSRRSSSSSLRPPVSTGSAATSSRSRSSTSSIRASDLEPAPGPSLIEIVARQTGSIVNAGAIVLVAAMLVWFGVRPGLKMLLAPPAVAGAPGRGTRPRSRRAGVRRRTC